jgi:hypothetical protein
LKNCIYVIPCTLRQQRKFECNTTQSCTCCWWLATAFIVEDLRSAKESVFKENWLHQKLWWIAFFWNDQRSSTKLTFRYLSRSI